MELEKIQEEFRQLCVEMGALAMAGGGDTNAQGNSENAKRWALLQQRLFKLVTEALKSPEFCDSMFKLGKQ